MIAWLVDAAAIVAQQALRDSSYAPYARTMRKICWEESVHIMHGRDVVVTMVTGTAAQRAAIQDALERWWGPLMQMHGPRSPREQRPRPPLADQGEDLRGAAPGVPDDLRAADPRARPGHPGRRAALGRRRRGWRYTEPDWAELRTVVTNHGPMSQERLAFRRTSREETRWVRETVLGVPRRAASTPASLEPWEVFRQEREGDPMRHGGSVMAPDAELAAHYARELFGRRQESVRLWVVRRADIVDIDDPDLLQPPLDRSFKKPGGYVMRDKLAAAREAAGQPKPKARSRMTVGAPPAARVALDALLCSMADDEFVIGFSDSEWTGHRAAPRGGRRDELARPGRDRARGGALRPARPA